MLQESQPKFGKQGVNRTVFRAEDPAHDDRRDRDRQQLRQVEQSTQEGSRLTAELLLNHIGQQRGDEQAENGRDDHDGDNDPE